MSKSSITFFIILWFAFAALAVRAYNNVARPLVLAELPLLSPSPCLVALIPDNKGGFKVPNQDKAIYQSLYEDSNAAEGQLRFADDDIALLEASLLSKVREPSAATKAEEVAAIPVKVAPQQAESSDTSVKANIAKAAESTNAKDIGVKNEVQIAPPSLSPAPTQVNGDVTALEDSAVVPLQKNEGNVAVSKPKVASEPKMEKESIFDVIAE